MKTLPLDPVTWDIVLDDAGNWSAIDDEAAYAAQTVANKWLSFTNDSFLFPKEGIPYQKDVLGKRYPRSLVEEHLRRSAVSVPLVVRCEVLGFEFANRTIHATGIIYTENGGRYNVSI